MKRGIIILIVALIIIGGLIYFIYSRGSSDNTEGGLEIIPSDDNNEVQKDNQNNEAGNSEESSSVSYTVEIIDFKFVPENLNIKKGESVTWINRDGIRHSATSDDGKFDSGLLAKDKSFTFVFDEAGTYSYHCTPHPYMKGKIVVE